MMNGFCERLNQAMQISGMTQTELSASAGISKSAICQYISGKNEPKPGSIRKLAAALKVSEAWLLGDDAGAAVSQKKCISIAQAAEEMGKARQFVRLGLQRGQLPFGTAVKMSTKWTYYISPERFNQYIGKGRTA